MEGDGNGWAAGPEGSRRWGLYGAAGLVLTARCNDQPCVLLQHRALWTAQGGTWAVPGGARDSHETATAAAVREAVEEASIDPSLVHVHATRITAGPYPFDPERPDLVGGWTYTSVIATTTTGHSIATAPDKESVELRWVHYDEVTNYPLLPAFRASWPMVRDIALAALKY